MAPFWVIPHPLHSLAPCTQNTVLQLIFVLHRLNLCPLKCVSATPARRKVLTTSRAHIQYLDPAIRWFVGKLVVDITITGSSFGGASYTDKWKKAWRMFVSVFRYSFHHGHGADFWLWVGFLERSRNMRTSQLNQSMTKYSDTEYEPKSEEPSKRCGASLGWVLVDRDRASIGEAMIVVVMLEFLQDVCNIFLTCCSVSMFSGMTLWPIGVRKTEREVIWIRLIDRHFPCLITWSIQTVQGGPASNMNPTHSSDWLLQDCLVMYCPIHHGFSREYPPGIGVINPIFPLGL